MRKWIEEGREKGEKRNCSEKEEREWGKKPKKLENLDESKDEEGLGEVENELDKDGEWKKKVLEERSGSNKMEKMWQGKGCK